MHFVRGPLFSYLANAERGSGQTVLSAIFSERHVVVCKSPENLIDVLRHVDRIDFSRTGDRHTISNVYEELLRRLGSENKLAGEFYTPRPLIRFMISILNPKIGETVFDPASGSCGFLVECFDAMAQRSRSRNQLSTLQSKTFYANEKKSVPALMGLINMVLHGINVPHLRRVNTLESSDEESPHSFDVILTNPPFGGLESRETHKRFAIQSRATEVLFMQRIFDYLSRKRTARCGVVLPDGFLFRSGPFAAVKKRLVEEFNLRLIASLPSGAFAPYSDLRTAILFFDRSGPTTNTVFYSIPPPAGGVPGKFCAS
jgi:type I restriction enzyme M protein